MSNCQRERHSFRCDRIDSVLWEFSIGTDKDAEFDSRDEPGTVLEEGSLPPQTNVHETCKLHGKGKVQSVEQQISQVAGTRSIDWTRRIDPGCSRSGMEEVTRHWHYIMHSHRAASDRQLYFIRLFRRCSLLSQRMTGWITRRLPHPSSSSSSSFVFGSWCHHIQCQYCTVISRCFDLQASGHLEFVSFLWRYFSFDLDAVIRRFTRTGSLSFCSCFSEHADVFHLTRRSVTVSFSFLFHFRGVGIW